MRDEGMGTLVKVVDFEVCRKTAEPAHLLIAETLTDPGIIEIGYLNGQRYTVTLTGEAGRQSQPRHDPERGDCLRRYGRGLAVSPAPS